MKAKELTQEHIEHLDELYAQFFFPKGSTRSALYITEGLLEIIVKDLVTYGSYNPRVGSRWTPHSKLDLKLDHNGDVVAVFEPNFDRTERERNADQYKEALEAGDSFSRAFMEYLAGNNSVTD